MTFLSDNVLVKCFSLMLSCLLVGCCGAAGVLAQSVGVESGAIRLIDREKMSTIESIVQAGIEKGQMPGCVVAAGNRSGLFYLEAFGQRQLQPEKRPMEIDTVFDLASLTKPLATAVCCMRLLEQGSIELDEPVSKYLPEFKGHGKEEITIRQLLLHQGGLIPDNSLRDYQEGVGRAYQKIDALKLVAKPGEKFIYTDVGFIVLGRLVERVSGHSLDEACRQFFWKSMGMTETGFHLDDSLMSRAAVTQKRNDEWIQGEVHDPRAFLLDGVAGHAGMFSTVRDLAKFAQMLLCGGVFDEKQLLRSETIALMARPYRVSTGIRGLGWDKQTGYSSNRAKGLSARAIGHGGFTGTAIWIDPKLDLFYIFLSNRVHPDGKGSVNRLIGEVGQVIVEAANDLELSSRSGVNGGKRVQTGLDILVQQHFEPLRGKRVGLITNHTGVDGRGRMNIDLLLGSDQLELVRLFSPEHGIEGVLDQSTIADSKSQGSNLDVVSLYGKERRPTAEQLEGIDCLVFDIQDIGTRFYTYISTMQYAMQSAAENNLEFVILDRPNPIGGRLVRGPMLDPDRLSFVGCHSLPVRHGMTAGELARLFVAELKLDLKLAVVPVEGWSRSGYFDQTGLPWINPSPNMRNMNQALLYPGVGLLEYTNVSVGRGTDTPFEIFGAPWMDRVGLAARLNDSGMEGVLFMPRSFTPSDSKFKGEVCHGVSISITDRNKLRSVRLGFEIASALRDLYPQDWKPKSFNRLLGNESVFQAFLQGADWEQLHALYQPGVRAFSEQREPYLLYK